MLLFVYGSLLRGEDNHAVLSGARLPREGARRRDAGGGAAGPAPARFVAAARTAARYTLVDLGPYPALVEGGGTAVAGELFEVDAPLLALLDDFEGHPDEYVRSPVALEGGAAAEAYLLPADRAAGFPPVASGDWRAHRAI